MRRRQVFRSWAVAWAVLQFALPAAVTVGDARVERDSVGGATAHVESASGKACRPVHRADCALCQFVSHFAATANESAAPTIVAAVHPPQPLAARSCTSAVLARLSLPRAPPRA
jgi:hypothetical protein